MRPLQSPRPLCDKGQLRLSGILLLLLPLVFMGCDRSDEAKPAAATPTPAPAQKGVNYITAMPNPVPAGPEPRGKTIVKWSTRDIPPVNVHVYVYEEGGKESLFSTGGEGSQEAPWIPDDRPVEFRLYSGEGANRKLLDKVSVIREK